MTLRVRRPRSIFSAALIGVVLAAPTAVHAQRPPAPAATITAAAGDDLDAINARYLDDLTALETRRLQQIDALAQKLTGAQQVEAYAALFQGALASGIYGPAEPAAERLIRDGHTDPGLLYLASLVNILAEIERGDYDNALASLKAAVQAGKKPDADGEPVGLVTLPRDTRLMVAETCYQRLVQADQFDIAKQAFALIARESPDEAIRTYAANRLRRLEMIGTPAPPFEGRDIDGQPFRLADTRGDVVLLVFWASWCIPCGPEADHLVAVLRAYKQRGLRVVGVNLDAMHDPDESPAALEASVRRFLVDHHVGFPNLLNAAQGNPDIAAAYGITDIPANVLIDRNGNIAHIDLTASNLEPVLKRTLGQ
ncbi:MAG: hypothetical protein KatS3mg108_0456 [Isosphaeraceae bacterium]|jgi:peroxiredoxin|nr:MAG: hypothetical protein KatS3mg108_0456 [Isosphaeraceae bacterium]